MLLQVLAKERLNDRLTLKMSKTESRKEQISATVLLNVLLEVSVVAEEWGKHAWQAAIQKIRNVKINSVAVHK